MSRRIGAMAIVAVLVGAVACSKGANPPSESAPPPKAGSGAASAVSLCEHRVPAELCTRCNPELAEAFKEMGDWCGEHGVPESQCLQCNPGLKFTATAEPKDWCGEHGLPESKCTKCNPKLVAKFIEAGDYCREHGLPESVCPICNPELAKAGGASSPAPVTKVRLASEQTVRDVGIATTRAEKRRFSRTLEVVGQLGFNANRHAQLSARGEALVTEVLVDIGDEVKKGQPLVVLASSAVGAGQAQLTAARARVDTAKARLERETALAKRGISAQKDVEEAQRELSSAQAEFDAARSALAAAGASSSGATGRYSLTAPFAGTVVARHAVAGKTASSGEVLIEVADLSSMWALLDVPEGDAGQVRPGQRVEISIEGAHGEAREAVIARVAASVDPHSRTVSARVDLPNPDRTLKAGVFLRGKIQVAAEHDALMVPSAAIQRAENQTLVFVKSDATAYEPVAVKLGASDGEQVEVLEGLEPGAEVVTTGAFLLKTEILKDSIGAGCCETGEK